MELTWLALTSVLLLGVGYAFVQRAQRSRFVCWFALTLALFGLATRDLLRFREQNRPGSTSGIAAGEHAGGTDPEKRERRRPPLFARLLQRVAGWLT
ncbi:hypothetical protein BRC82_03225 [Halobacteriales archaeon QS_1_67_19]|nr:MAG: hypothetical protein BRC82_03225 [Halobacteriales archaeon QS_1_67_19]